MARREHRPLAAPSTQRDDAAPCPHKVQRSFAVLGSAVAVMVVAVAVVVLSTAPALAADHVVRPGETLSTIARRYGVSTTELVRLNQLGDPNHLLVGTRLRLPSPAGGAGGAAPAKTAAAPGGQAAGNDHGPSFALGEEQRRQTDRLLGRAAREFGVPSSLLKALTYTESRWQQDAVSSIGAVGVGQLLPATARWLSTVMDEPGLDLRSTEDNIRMSARLLRYLLDTTGSTRSALAAYYQGIGAVLRTGISAGGARYAAVIAARQAWFG